jgi:hypothetical protein
MNWSTRTKAARKCFCLSPLLNLDEFKVQCETDAHLSLKRDRCKICGSRHTPLKDEREL